MNPNTGSAPVISDAAKKKIDELAKTFDPVFPSTVIAPGAAGIDDASQMYGSEGRNKPAFVLADDENFEGA